VKRKFLVPLLVVILGIAASGCGGDYGSFFLRVESLDQGEVLLNLPVRPGDQIYLHWIHSSAKTPILDTFEVGDKGEMLLVEEDYQWYGAGLEFTDHQGISVAPKGKGTKVVLERRFSYLLLRVGWVANQNLIINGETVPLLRIAQGGELLKISIVETSK
jgi:hypothetical protein